ncbi:MAG: hypothetical protein R3D98_10725 [Candidatus Krumholzibacteriia bacterium]
MNAKNIVCTLLALVAGCAAALADDLPEVPGIIGITPADAGSCIAVYVPMDEGTALSGILWYNNDGLVVYPEVLVASGVDASPEPVSSAFVVGTDVSGGSSAWSELALSEPTRPRATGSTWCSDCRKVASTRRTAKAAAPASASPRAPTASPAG